MRILVVDDSRTMRMLVIRTLRQAGYGDYDIVEAGDGLEALEMIQAGGVDVVLCDWNMPRMNGLELLQALRGAGDLRLFGFITSESTPHMRGLAEHEGASFVISKPFTAETFQSVLGGMDVAEHASFMHEGLPQLRHLDALLETLLGRPVETAASAQRVGSTDAGVTWTYAFPDGTVAAVGAMDLRLAAALGCGFGMLPVGRMTEALESGRLAGDLADNLREVLNVLVSLYSSMTDVHIGLGEVFAGMPDNPEVLKILGQDGARLDATVKVPGYGVGLISSVYAIRVG